MGEFLTLDSQVGEEGGVAVVGEDPLGVPRGEAHPRMTGLGGSLGTGRSWSQLQGTRSVLPGADGCKIGSLTRKHICGVIMVLGAVKTLCEGQHPARDCPHKI